MASIYILSESFYQGLYDWIVCGLLESVVRASAGKWLFLQANGEEIDLSSRAQCGSQAKIIHRTSSLDDSLDIDASAWEDTNILEIYFFNSPCYEMP